MHCWFILLFVLLIAGCRATSAKEVIVPGQERAFRVECNYEIANCRRQARKKCHGPYEEVSQGNKSCADCGMDWHPYVAHAPSPESSPAYRGVLYFRCK